MTTEQINILLDKYWNCETSVSEERELQDYFSGQNVFEEFTQYIPLFAYKNNMQTAKLSDDFDKNLEKAIREDKKYITVRIFAPMLRIAASVVLIVGLGLSILFISKDNNQTQFTENYSDSLTTLEQATYALQKVSNVLKTSQDASMQMLQDIENLGFDWSVLDSLSVDSPANAPETENTKNSL